ncbi:hypothetical protein RHMOL_Rhmol10G0204000 [Rhododendron molle]|nr:hypothetical protein RHMOL_Rhmol10G0204000 [Rhododendron molle]
MTNLLVEDPYFPYAFPYVYDYYQEHGEFPLLEGEEDGDVAIAPVLVQLAPPNGVEFVVEGEEEDPEEPPEEEDPEEPEEGSEDEDGFHDPPQNEADWQHLMQMQHLDDINDEWESDDEEILEEDPVMVAPDIMDLDFESNDIPPPPVEDDIGPYKAQLPIIF